MMGMLCLCSWSASAHTFATIDAGRGEVKLMLPSDYDGSKALPLVVSLHGFKGTGQSYIDYWTHNRQVDQQQFIVAAPDGTQDSKGRAFWNASEACCNKEARDVDDSAYLRHLIETVEAAYNIDSASIHVAGYSNGGFMAHRMACDHPDKVASISSFAGAARLDLRSCKTKGQTHVLQIHGTHDAIIFYGGGFSMNDVNKQPSPYPSALHSTSMWVGQHGGSMVPQELDMLDLSERIPGIDSTVWRFATQGKRPIVSELWSIHGETHVPKMNQRSHVLTAQWLLAHRKDGIR
jgi:polyhydroxybutyrate depolymerase